MTLRVFIGADERQPIAFNVAQHSIYQKASQPVAVTRLVQDTLPVKRRGLTSFTYTRYLVPWLCNYQGWALFMDADTLVRDDISKVFDCIPEMQRHHPVYVVPHDTVTMPHGKQVSVMFERNAVMLFNNAACSNLTPEFIEKQTPNKLDTWASSIGHLPKEWNHLVGYDKPNPAAAIAHFTMGIPCFPKTQDDEFAGEWQEAHLSMNSTVTWDEIMGPSVHAQWKR